jgi:hypothetical protein
MLKIFRAVVLFALPVLLCVWVLQGSPSFQKCVQDKDVSGDNATRDYLTTFTTRANIVRDCLGDFVHDWKDETLVVFTIILALSTIFLWVATRDLVNGAEKTAKQQLRAYVGVAGIDIKKVIANERPVISLAIQNFGQTPAYGVHYWLDSIVAEKDAVRLKFDAQTFSGKSVLNPGDNFRIISTAVKPLTSVQVDQVLADTQRIFLQGEIRYWDVFKKYRKTLFRHETAGKDVIAMERLTPSEKGNIAT